MRNLSFLKRKVLEVIKKKVTTSGENVLIVDNDRDMCEVISDILKEEGYKVSIAYEGNTALASIKKNMYGVVILDYKLFGKSGLVLLEKARQIKPSLRVIMVSAYGSEHLRSKALELGAYDCLDKPFDINTLLHIVKKALVKKN